jgi:hypothetical protein
MFTVIELGSGGYFVGWEEKMCQLYRKVTRIVASQSYRKGSGDRSCTEPIELDFLWTSKGHISSWFFACNAQCAGITN